MDFMVGHNNTSIVLMVNDVTIPEEARIGTNFVWGTPK
jgi:hypothetical protein